MIESIAEWLAPLCPLAQVALIAAGLVVTIIVCLFVAILIGRRSIR